MTSHRPLRPVLHWPLLALSLLTLWNASTAFAAGEADRTALDEYVAQPDPTYRWELVSAEKGDGVTTYVVDLRSQTWRTTADVDRTEWQHWLIIVKPDEVKPGPAFLFISGGGNGREAPKKSDQLMVEIAKSSGAVAAELKMIPNQPLIFENDGKKRSEDDLIAYTWNKVIETGDPTWSARLPMVKGAVRAMDTITALLAAPEQGGIAVDRYVVSGGSKRGWTTWLTGAVDPRVVAIIPAVIDVLNMKASMTHHYEAYGYWAPAVGDYVHHKIMDKQDTPGYELLLKFEDPYSYRQRLTMPKFVVCASGDQFFLPDSSQFYFDELVGEKYLRYVPNAEHSLSGTDAPQSVETFFRAVLEEKPRPKFGWTFEDDGSIRVTATDKPEKVTLWAAKNNRNRDFRTSAIGRAYEGTDLMPTAEGVYVGQVEQPEKGFKAYFVELTFPSGMRYPFKFSTPVRVTPNVLPFKGKLQAKAAKQKS